MANARIGRARKRLLALDPGLLRLSAGARTVLGLAGALTVLVALGAPQKGVLAGGFMAVATALAISEHHVRRQLTALLLGSSVAVPTLTLGTLLAVVPAAWGAGLLVVVLVGTYARRNGRRGTDLGIFAFMAYLLSQFAGLRPPDLPMATGAAAVAAATFATARFCVLPVRSRRRFRTLLEALEACRSDARRASTEPARHTGSRARRTERLLRRRLVRLHACTRLVQEFLDEAPAGSLPGGAAAARRAERAAAATWARGTLAILDARAGSARGPGPERVSTRGEAPLHARRPGTSPRAAPVWPWVRPGRTTRQALQVTTAVALALVGGHLVSPQLWHWAVVTAWVVFLRAEHTEDVLLQSGRRLVGTVAGVPVGYGLAVVAAGHEPVLAALLLGFVLGIFSTPPRRYWAVTFFITGALSMALTLQGALSAAVLLLRVHETLLGALCAVCAAVLVAPLGAGRIADERLSELLRVAGGLTGPGLVHDGPRCAGSSRDLRLSLEAYREAVRPLLHPLSLRRRERVRVRRTLERVETSIFGASCPVVPTRRPQFPR
ncbi:FUSC family protein [Promicromonospora sp. NPDC060204]|uniref:FUSC family protein n=1 Tax=Promicromonospora sp. NPDC060204 TaxID=3347071 RepID=UPI003656ACB9